MPSRDDYIDKIDPYLNEISRSGHSAAAIIFRGVPDSEDLFDGLPDSSEFVAFHVAIADVETILSEVAEVGEIEVPDGWLSVAPGYLSVIVAFPDKVHVFCYFITSTPPSVQA